MCHVLLFVYTTQVKYPCYKGEETPPAALQQRYDIIKPFCGESINESIHIIQVPYVDETTTKTAYLEWLNNGGAEYLKTNPTTKEGMASVAKFNGFDKKWSAYVEANPKDSTRTKYHKLFVMFVESKDRNGNNWFYGPCEGRHRMGTELLTLLGARYDEMTGTFTLNSLQYGDIQYLKGGTPLTGDILADRLDPILEGTQTTKMLTQRFTVRIVFPNTNSANVKVTNEQLIRKSEKIARQKTESCLPKLCAGVARETKNLIQLLQSKDREDRPNFHEGEDIRLSTITHVTPANLKEELEKKGGSEDVAYPKHRFMESDEYNRYVGDPFNIQKRQALRDKLARSMMPTASTTYSARCVWCFSKHFPKF